MAPALATPPIMDDAGDDEGFFAIGEARNPFVKTAAATWQSLCKGRRFPERADLTLRALAPVLPHAVIVAVIDGGGDYEFRYVGEAQRQAFKASFKGVRVSQIEAASPALGAMLRGAYDQTRITGTPFVARGRLHPDSDDMKYIYHENAFFPLGSGDTVDHLLIVGVHVPRPFLDIAEEARTGLVHQVGALPSPD